MDLDTPFYAALSADATITGSLGEYLNGYAIFTRVPVPEMAEYPMIVVMPAAAVTDEDGLSNARPSVVKDIVVYGEQDSDYRTVETLAWAIRNKFHGQEDAITVTGYSVVRMRADGPFPAPASDERHVARAVSLSILLSEN